MDLLHLRVITVGADRAVDLLVFAVDWTAIETVAVLAAKFAAAAIYIPE